MRRMAVGVALTCLLSLQRARAEDIRKHDLRQPCPTAYRKGGLHCERLGRLETKGYQVDIPSCPRGGCKLRAGAFKVDITPPPGFPMGGNGFPAHFGRGYWSRLYARAFFFRDSRNQSLALVSCDLGAMSSGLQAKVAESLHRENPALNLSRDNLILSATHVHQGPGNFMSFKLYNDMGSRAKGFDSDLFEALANRIAAAVIRAAEIAEASGETTLVLKEGKVDGILRNRAVEPFMLNRDREVVLSEGPSYPCDPPAAGCPCPDEDPYRKDCPRYRAVDERVRVLEIRRKGEPQEAASLVFLSVHPEAMSHETQLYQSDFTGLAMSLLEKARNKEDRRGPYVAGFFNGAEGDISVRWKKQNRNEAVTFAHSLLDTITNKLADVVTIDRDAAFQVAGSELSSNCYSAEAQVWRESYGPGCYESSKVICISGKPMYGVATMGGAEDSRSPLYDLGWKGGSRVPPRDLQGVKQGALESSFVPDPLNPKKLLDLTPRFGPPCYYPEKTPISLVRIESPTGSLWLGGLPGEPTRTVWRRIENALTPLAPKASRILPIGIANEYIGYITTREEYAAQAYEGASTIYGPYTAELLEAVLLDLSKPGQAHPPIDEKHHSVEAGVFFPEVWDGKSTFGPGGEWMKAGHGDPDEALENLIADGEGRPERHWPRFQWGEGAGEIDEEWKAGARFVDICELPSGAPADDDRGPNILTVFINPEAPGGPVKRFRADPRRAGSGPMKARRVGKGESRRWTAIWLPPNRLDSRDFYFRVTLADGKTRRCSKGFKIADVMSQDTPDLDHAPCPH